MSGLWRERAPLVLASRSAIRAKLLRDVGLKVETHPSGIDERAVEAGLADATPPAVAKALAAAKAVEVSGRAPGRLVVGADQTLALGGKRFSKPVSLEAGKDQLRRLSGKRHTLSSGVALARDGIVLWSVVTEANLTMRVLSEPFLDAYLAAAGDDVLTSVGGYQFEGAGVHLFEQVEGDCHTILGLPLLPLLQALRDAGALLS